MIHPNDEFNSENFRKFVKDCVEFFQRKSTIVGYGGEKAFTLSSGRNFILRIYRGLDDSNNPANSIDVFLKVKPRSGEKFWRIPIFDQTKRRKNESV